MIVTEEKIKELEARVRSALSERRYIHTLGVRRAALRLGEALLQECELCELSAASLLHDIAKEIPESELYSMVRSRFPKLSEDALVPAVLHSYAAPIIIERDFPEFATEKILSATYSHTLGSENMTLFDKIIFIADYVEDGRVWHACRTTADKLFLGFESLDRESKIKRLNEAIIESIDNTVRSLQERGERCAQQMLLTRAAISAEI